jgi:hypothetical protein
VKSKNYFEQMKGSRRDRFCLCRLPRSLADRQPDQRCGRSWRHRCRGHLGAPGLCQRERPPVHVIQTR